MTAGKILGIAPKLESPVPSFSFAAEREEGTGLNSDQKLFRSFVWVVKNIKQGMENAKTIFHS